MEDLIIWYKNVYNVDKLFLVYGLNSLYLLPLDVSNCLESILTKDIDFQNEIPDYEQIVNEDLYPLFKINIPYDLNKNQLYMFNELHNFIKEQKIVCKEKLNTLKSAFDDTIRITIFTRTEVTNMQKLFYNWVVNFTFTDYSNILQHVIQIENDFDNYIKNCYSFMKSQQEITEFEMKNRKRKDKINRYKQLTLFMESNKLIKNLVRLYDLLIFSQIIGYKKMYSTILFFFVNAINELSVDEKEMLKELTLERVTIEEFKNSLIQL